MMLLKTRYLTVLGALACVAFAGQARADLIGTSITQGTIPTAITSESASNLANETLLGTDLNNPLLGNPLLTGNLANAVFRNSQGQLDFLFQLRLDANAVPVTSVAVNNFAGFATFAGTLTGALPTNATGIFTTGTVGPTTAQRGPTGADVLFDGFTLSGGQTSSVFFVRTNATNFNQLGQALLAASVSSNGGAVATAKFEPTAVPEPATFAGAAVAGLFGLGLALRRKLASA